jgi:L-ribulose-5-phosphate 3-epimerase
MYKAINYWVYGGFGPNKTPYEFIDFAKAQGLDGVELTLGDCLPVNITRDECEKIAAYAEEEGIGLKTMATGNYGVESLGADDEAERVRAVAFTKKYLQIAAWLKVKTILVVPGSTSVAWDPSRPVVPYVRCWEQSTKSIKELLPVADELDVDIALENVWMRFLLSPMEWKFFLDQFNSDRIGMYLDLGNCQIYLPAQDYITLLGKRIKAVHVKNWKGEDCGGGLHGFGDSLKEGDVDFKAAFAALKKIGYNGALTVEMIPFSRLPDLVLPDEELAVKVAEEIKSLVDA